MGKILELCHKNIFLKINMGKFKNYVTKIYLKNLIWEKFKIQSQKILKDFTMGKILK